MTIFNSLAWPFPLCYFANKTTERVMSLGDAIYNSNWYEYPRGMAKYPILIIAQSQTPIYFFGYGLFRCTLEVYGRVSSKSFNKQAFICPYLKKNLFLQIVKTSYSYYMILRNISER